MKSRIVVLALAAGATCTPASDDAPRSEARASTDSIVAITENSCEGEGCQASYRATACRDVKLVAGPRNPTAATTLERGDTIDVQTDLHLKKPGVVVLKRDVTVPDEWNTELAKRPDLRFAAGDSLLLLNYIGEGFWNVSYKGRHIEVLEFWGGPGQAETGSNDSAQAATAVGTAPEIDTWLRVSRGGQVIGWWLDDESEAFVPIGEYGEKWGLSCPGP